MESWHRVLISDAIRGASLRNQFTALFIASGCPLHAAMFGAETGAEGTEYWFSPGAAQIARDLIRQFGGQATAAPKRAPLQLVAGDDSGVTCLQRTAAGV